MPCSTLSAVRTPGSESPNSTSVMATAGRIPTTTVSASSTRDIAAILPSIRPMNESTISSDEMSINTPRARVLAIPSVKSSCSVRARRSCMSTWIVTSRQSPIFKIGIRSISPPSTVILRARDDQLGAPQSDSEGVGKTGLGDHVGEIDAQMNDRLRDLRADAADYAIGPHQPGRGHGLEQVLRHQRVHRRHSGDVNDGYACAGLDDLLQQALHHHLRPRAVERADQRQGENALPQHDDRS